MSGRRTTNNNLKNVFLTIAGTAMMVMILMPGCTDSDSDDDPATATPTATMTEVPTVTPTPTPTVTHSIITFRKVYSEFDRSRAKCVRQLPDEGYVFLAESRTTQEPPTDVVLLVRTDRLGDVLWSREWSGNGYAFAEKVVPTEDGGFAFCGSWCSGYSYPYEGEPLVVKTNSLGIEEWRIPASVFPTHSSVQSILQTEDRGYAVVGHHSTSTERQSFLLKLDADGRPLWNQTWDYPDLYGSDLQQTPDGGYLLGEDYDLGLIRTDTQGNELWRDYEPGGGGTFTAVVCTLDGGFFGVACRGGMADIYYIDLAKWNNDGTREWFHSYDAEQVFSMMSAWQCHDGGYVYSSQWVLARLDRCGNLIWWKSRFNRYSAGSLSSVQETSDFGFILSSSINVSYPNFHPVLIKTDAAGKVW